jgi:hypothetical protein
MCDKEKTNKKTDDSSSSIHEVVIRPIPDDVAKYMWEYRACIIARDDMINRRILGYKKGKRFAIDAEKARVKFWQKIYKLYPETAYENITVSYKHDSQTIEYKKVV